MHILLPIIVITFSCRNVRSLSMLVGGACRAWWRAPCDRCIGASYTKIIQTTISNWYAKQSYDYMLLCVWHFSSLKGQMKWGSCCRGRKMQLHGQTLSPLPHFNTEFEQFWCSLSATIASKWNVRPDNNLHIQGKLVFIHNKCYGPQNFCRLENLMSFNFCGEAYNACWSLQ